MKYLTSRELAEQWNVSRRRILFLAANGKIEGAEFRGASWVFPENTQKPTDGRTKLGMAEKREKDTFRYPLFEFKEAASFTPSLTKDELTIKRFTEAFHAFCFPEAKAILGNLANETQNKYTYIAALYCECMVSIFLCDVTQFYDSYGKLKKELTEDFPHKGEMIEYIHEIDSVLGADEYYLNEFPAQPAYCYHESFLPRFCNLSALWIALGERELTPTSLSAYEANCALLEQTDNVFDLQALHMYLACAYSMLDNAEACSYHFDKALKIAEQYHSFYTIAIMGYYYTQKSLDEALQGYSEDFKQAIKQHSQEFHTCHIRFTNALHTSTLYKFLTTEDYLYIIFAVQGLTNKEVAQRMCVSTGTVGKRYSQIYVQFGVENKAEMVELYHRLIEKSNVYN